MPAITKNNASYNMGWLVLCLFVQTVIRTTESGESCNRSIELADQCARHSTIFGNPDVIIPTNEQELDDHCKITSRSIRCLRQFGRQCLPTFPRQALQILAQHMRKVVQRRCRDRRSRLEFLNHSKCWTPKERLTDVNACVDQHIAHMEYVSRRVDPEYQIPAICCTFNQRVECIEREMSKICDQNNVEYVRQMFDDSTQGLMSFACTKFDSVRACDRNFNREIWNRIKQSVHKSTPEHSHRSILGPIVDIVRGQLSS